jgi:uncharacterized RDD family membrane protein YckC
MTYCRKCGAEIKEGAKFCSVCGTAVAAPDSMESLKKETPPISGLTLATWGERFVAWLIDVVIIGAITGLLGLLTSVSLLTTIPGWPGWIPFFNFNPNGIVLFLYWMFMDSIYGQSFGKMIMRIRVTKLDGARVGMSYAALESVGKAFLLPIDLLIGYFLYPGKRQRIFNHISETIVVRIT